MEKQIYSVSYSGRDKDTRIDCLEYIRQQNNPTGSTVLDTRGLGVSSRDPVKDAGYTDENDPEVITKFFKVHFTEEEEQWIFGDDLHDRLKVDVQPTVPTENTKNKEPSTKQNRYGEGLIITKNQLSKSWFFYYNF